MAPLRTLASAFLARRNRRRSINQLQGLDDRTLQDIGIARAEIGAVVDGLIAGTSTPARGATPATKTADGGRHEACERALAA